MQKIRIGSLVLISAALAYSQNFSGAIYTSLSNGTSVNSNLYSSRDAVYLNGGPQNLNGSGLPDGTYYYQVTDPSGSTLLSTDNAVCRQLSVVNGVVSGSTGPACKHANGLFNPANLSTPVQLIPFDLTPNAGGEYKVWLIRQTSNTSISSTDPRVINFRSNDSKTDNFKIGTTTPCPDCGPQPDTHSVSGKKYYDANANGVYDSGEAPVPNITINLYTSGILAAQACTDTSGQFSFTNLANATAYGVTETLPTFLTQYPYWVQTGPAPDSKGVQGYSGTINGANVTGLDFGNVCFVAPSGGLTLGFWSNKNGQAAINNCTTFSPDALAYLRTLNLVNPDGTYVKAKGFQTGTNKYGTTYADFRTWLLNGNAVNMAYMLSVQMAATVLDTGCGVPKKLDPNTIVDARSLGLGFVTISALINAANTELALTSPAAGNLTFTGNPLRADEEILKNALDAINNNKLGFASGDSAPCLNGVSCPPYQTTPATLPQ